MTPEENQAIDSRAKLAREITRHAGKIAWDHFEKEIAYEMKNDDTPVTVADKAAEIYLREQIGKQFPEDGVLGEEFPDHASSSGYKWIIDPIDATKNFIRGIPLFATLVGLEHNDEMVGGFIHVPCFDHLYHATRGNGAYRGDMKLNVSTIDTMKDSMLAYSSIEWFDRTKTTDKFLTLLRAVGRTRGFGDFYGYLLVAEGAIEVMAEPAICPWDIAALQPIIEEAGGVFTDWHGKRTIYGEGCIAGNPAIHAETLKLIHG